MKQTAVELLKQKLLNDQQKFPIYSEYINSVIDYLGNQLLEMEKQQIIDCGNTCALMQYIHVDKVSQMSNEEVEKLAEEDNITFGEQYYDETFKNK